MIALKRFASDIRVDGLPESLPGAALATCRSRLHYAIEQLAAETNLQTCQVKINLNIPETPAKSAPTQGDDPTEEERASQYTSSPPVWSLEQLVVGEDLLERLRIAAITTQDEALLFEEWGLSEIEPNPCTALNFYGPSGTGKTLCAHAIASLLDRPIMATSYAQVESHYVGIGPKNIRALFAAATRDRAVLFIDEADSLLSRRFANATQGSEQAINSMRSELLLCLQQFKGLVIFATNLVESYDPAFDTRVNHIHFPLPDTTLRAKLWRKHMPMKLPLDQDVDIDALASIEGMCGRDIKNAVLQAARRTYYARRAAVTQGDLLASAQQIMEDRAKVRGNTPQQIVTEPDAELSERIQKVCAQE